MLGKKTKKIWLFVKQARAAAAENLKWHHWTTFEENSDFYQIFSVLSKCQYKSQYIHIPGIPMWNHPNTNLGTTNLIKPQGDCYNFKARYVP